jgi:alpha-beta hydrolase superfamily lysophospholipase
MYFAALAPLLGARKGGLQGWDPLYLVLLRLAIALAVILSVLLDRAVFPFQGRPLPATGRYATASLSAQVTRRGMDFMMRVYYPALPRPGADRLPYLLYGPKVMEGVASMFRFPAFLFTWAQYTRPWCYDGDPTFCPPVPAAGADSGMPVPPGRFPVAVLSFGLGGSPDTYSALISELCSKGWVVIAPEHADGTGAYTAFEDGYKIWYEHLTDRERTDRSLEWKRRHDQLRMRVGELQACVDMAVELAHDGGTPPRVVVAPGAAGSSRRGPALAKAAPKPALSPKLRVEDDGVDERDVVAAADVKEKDEMSLLRMMLGGRVAADDGSAGTARVAGCGVYLIGHSFGGASVLLTGEADTRVSAVLGLDPWAMPMSAAVLSRGLPRVPVCALVSEAWGVWRENDTAMRMLFDGAYRGAHVGAAGSPPVLAGTLPMRDSNGVDKAGAVMPGFAVEEGTAVGGVHPFASYLLLKDSRHHSFSDMALLAEGLTRTVFKGIGRRPAAEQLEDVRRVVTSYPIFAAGLGGAGGKGGAAATAGGRYQVPPAVKARILDGCTNERAKY